MTNKKKEIPMPKLQNKNESANRKVVYYGWVATIIAVVGLFFLSLWVREQSKQPTEPVQYIEKNVVNKYVCKVVGAVPDEDVFAVECLTK